MDEITAAHDDHHCVAKGEVKIVALYRIVVNKECNDLHPKFL